MTANMFLAHERLSTSKQHEKEKFFNAREMGKIEGGRYGKRKQNVHEQASARNVQAKEAFKISTLIQRPEAPDPEE